MKKKSTYNIDFVNRKLTEGEKKKFLKWREENEADLFSFLDALTGSACKLSLSYNHSNVTASSSVTCQDESDVNYRRCVVSRHEDVTTALFISLYKHFEILDGTDWTEGVDVVDWG